MTEAFFTPTARGFRASEHTRGPWHQDFQHAGPPAALLARAIEQQADGLQVVRLGVDLFRPIPLAELRIDVTQRDGGRRRRVLEAVLIDAATDKALARAQALVLAATPQALGELPGHDPAPPVPVDEAEPFEFDFFRWPVGYHTAMALRLAAGGPGQGHCQMWMRQRIPLVPDEAPTGLQRLMCVADSGNGVSMVLDPRRFSFVNPDLTVNLRRPPEGEWICLDAATHVQPSGLGMAESRLWDCHGVVANGTQNLLVQAQQA